MTHMEIRNRDEKTGRGHESSFSLKSLRPAHQLVPSKLKTRLAPATNSWAHKVLHVWTHTTEGGVRGGTPAPRRLHGMRGDDKTADAGCGAHRAVQHVSSGSAAGSVGGLGGAYGEAEYQRCWRNFAWTGDPNTPPPGLLICDSGGTQDWPSRSPRGGECYVFSAPRCRGAQAESLPGAHILFPFLKSSGLHEAYEAAKARIL
jgi:hypothetical protein